MVMVRGIGSSQTVGGLSFCGFDSWELVVSVVHNTVGALDLLWKGVKLERRVGVVNHLSPFGDYDSN